MGQLGFRSCDDHEGPPTTGGPVEATNVYSHEELMAEVVEPEIANRWARMLDVAQTYIVIGCIVGGFAWTAYRWFGHGQPGTSHTLYCLARAYPGPVLVLGVAFGLWWRAWGERHPWLLALVALLVGHCIYPVHPW